MKTVKVLLLEDDLEAVSKLFAAFKQLEEELNVIFSVMVLSEYTQAERVNSWDDTFDIVLLDRDCCASGSFHVLDIEKIGVDRVIAISSVPEYNEQARKRGVTKIAYKDYHNLEAFIKKVASLVKAIIE